MTLFKQNGTKLVTVKEKRIDLERTVQRLIEENLFETFGLQFVSSEFSVKNFRIDTVAYDEESKAFVILEYKRDKNFSVVDQGCTYLALVLQNKATFVLEYNEKNKIHLKISDVDWSQSRVVFLSSSFTPFQRGALGFQNLNIELWEARLFENDLLCLEHIHSPETGDRLDRGVKSWNSQKKTFGESNVAIVAREIKPVTVEDHFKKNWEKSKSLYEGLSQRILELDSNFKIAPVRSYIGFKLGKKNVVMLLPYMGKVTLDLLRVQLKDLKDPEKRARYRENSFKYYNQHICQFDITSTEDFDYALMLAKQVYNRFNELKA
jgi:predicted transport protein